jgi:phage tail-like protein
MAKQNPLMGYNFSVALLDPVIGAGPGLSNGSAPAAGGFSECSGLETTLEVEDYREGGNNRGVLHFPSRTTWAPIKLKRGITLDEDLWRWHQDFVEGVGSRRDGIIMLLDEQQRPARIWRFRRGLPVKWTGPQMNAGQAQVAIEEIEVVHEGLVMIPGGPPLIATLIQEIAP